MSSGASVIHLNAVNFMAAVEALRDPGLRGGVYVVAPSSGPRATILDASPKAVQEGVLPGMRLDEAEGRVGRLTVLLPSPAAYHEAGRRMEALCARYAPRLENPGGGHLYLDIGGTRRLFGDYLDTAARIRNEVAEAVGLEAATALAANKLVAKVGTRSLRPRGLVAIREGDEGAFLRHQDLGLLPGVGPAIGRLLGTVGITEIGGLAELDPGEALGLLGPQGDKLRRAARGEDPRPVMDGDLAERRIEASLALREDSVEAEAIHGLLLRLVEACGLELRLARLGCRSLALEVGYADLVQGRGTALAGRALALDRDLLAYAEKALAQARSRRVRVSSLRLSLGRLEPWGLQLDLFEPPGAPSAPPDHEAKALRAGALQRAVDGARRRYGGRALTRCATLLAQEALGEGLAEVARV